MDMLDFDLNIEPPPFNNNEPEGGPINSSMEDGQRGIWVPVSRNYDRASVRSARDLNHEPQGEFVFDFDLNEDYDDVINDDELETGPTNSTAVVGQRAAIHHVLVAPVERSLQPQGSPPYGPIEVVGLDSYDELEDNGWDGDILDDLFNFQSSVIAFEEASSSPTTQGIDAESLQIADNHQRNVRSVESQPWVNIRDLSVHLRGTESCMVAPRPPATPQPPTLECPICMKPLVEQMATRCGHMFCEGCIKTAIAVEAKCPICRREVAHRELRMIYFS